MNRFHFGYFGSGRDFVSGTTLIRNPTVIYPGCDIGEDFSTGHFVLIRDDCRIGDNVSVGTHTEIGPGVVIGNNVRIHSNCFIPELTIINEGAWIGPCVCICNDKWPGPYWGGTDVERQGVTIGRHATIGANVTILPGVMIGDGAFVGAGSVVTRNVEHDTKVYGNPARKR